MHICMSNVCMLVCMHACMLPITTEGLHATDTCANACLKLLYCRVSIVINEINTGKEMLDQG